ncbi:MAG: hypothetical protein IPN29_06530 [Saprospiraceae bacterium]|nr:hypothetical protein [Saprospiraceae bacterium]
MEQQFLFTRIGNLGVGFVMLSNWYLRVGRAQLAQLGKQLLNAKHWDTVLADNLATLHIPPYLEKGRASFLVQIQIPANH